MSTTAPVKSILVYDIRSVFAILAPQLLSDWKFVLRRLGISDQEINEVVALNRDKKPAEVVYRGLIRWEHNTYGKPSLDNLQDALTELGMQDAAHSVSKYRVMYGGPYPASLAESVTGARRRVLPHPEPPVRRSQDFTAGPRTEQETTVRRRTEREMSDDTVVRHIAHPMARYRYPGAYNLATHQEKVSFHPLATYRDPPGKLNRSFDLSEPEESPFHHPDRRRHSWSQQPRSLLYSHLSYSYISQVISPPRRFEREPWFTAIDFLKNGDILLLDKENKQVQVHQCRILPNCRRYVFSHSFRVCKDAVGSEPSDMAVLDSYIIIIDKGQRCLRIFTHDGKSTGSVKFRNQPRCVAVRGGIVAIAFWDLSQGRGSIVLYKAELEKVIGGRGRKLTLMDPKHVESAKECYDSIGINTLGDVIALSQDGRLFLHSLKSAFQDLYVCRNEVCVPRVRSMVVKDNIVVLCNTYQDHVSALGMTPTVPRTFDLGNINVIMSDEDGLQAPRAMAFHHDDLAIVHRYGGDVRLFGTVAWPHPLTWLPQPVTWSKRARNNGMVTFRL